MDIAHKVRAIKTAETTLLEKQSAGHPPHRPTPSWTLPVQVEELHRALTLSFQQLLDKYTETVSQQIMTLFTLIELNRSVVL